VTRHAHADIGRARASTPLNGLNDVPGLRKAALPDPPAREIADAGIDDAHAAGREVSRFAVTAGCSHMLVFIARRQKDGGPRGENTARQEVVGDPFANLPMRLAGGRRDEQQVQAGRERDVLDVRIHLPARTAR